MEELLKQGILNREPEDISDDDWDILWGYPDVAEVYIERHGEQIEMEEL